MPAVDHPVVERLLNVAERLERQVAAGSKPTDPQNTFIPFQGLAAFGVRYSRSHLMRLVGQGRFPKPVYLSARKIAWRMSDLIDWGASRPDREPKHYEKTSG